MDHDIKEQGTARIRPAESEADLTHIRALFSEYAESLDFDLCFQDFETELATLPGRYAPPSGELLLAVDGEEVQGCVALRRLDGDICEMKRLWVRPRFRGSGLGRQLAKAIIEEGRRIGYTTMRLDTVASMSSAISLYRSLGFVETPPYTDNPIPGALFMELRWLS